MRPHGDLVDPQSRSSIEDLEALDRLKAAVREVVRDELSQALAKLRPADDADLLDLDHAAARLGLGKSTVRKLAAKCELANVGIGRRLLFRPADLDAYANARRRSPEKVRRLAAP